MVIWVGNRCIIGIEINKAFAGVLCGWYREFAGIASHVGVTLIHDEAWLFLTWTFGRFDVLQMFFIDTWVATGVGAFTLSENGLYTREGWQVFLWVLTLAGVFSVSRWFDFEAVLETMRLLSLGVALLLDFGVAVFSRHLIFVTRERIVILLVSPTFFSNEDGATLRRIVGEHGFIVRVALWVDATDNRLRSIANVASVADFERATRDPYLDFTVFTDRWLFFFNMLKLCGFFQHQALSSLGVVSGNLCATRTLMALVGVAGVLVFAIIGWFLMAFGRLSVLLKVFWVAFAYFAISGFAFMLIQIAFLQRFSVYLGYLTYTFSIILFLMILSVGLGSLVLERIDFERHRQIVWLSVGIGVTVFLETMLLQSVVDLTVDWGLFGWMLVVVAFLVFFACALGYCFSIGLRLVGRHFDRVIAWMWGVNGACGVMVSILAVMGSMWVGI